jgi:hypothetical protein
LTAYLADLERQVGADGGNKTPNPDEQQP